MTPPTNPSHRHTSIDPDRLAHVVEDALGAIETRLQSIESRLPTEEEAKLLRIMLERDARVQWLWSTARAWALWIAAVVAGVTVGMDALKAMLKRLLA